MDMSRFTCDELILAGVALLLAIDLLYVPWFDISIGIGAFKVSATGSATGSPYGWLGVLAVLATLAMMAYLALERLGNVELRSQGELPAYACEATVGNWARMTHIVRVNYGPGCRLDDFSAAAQQFGRLTQRYEPDEADEPR